jgi:hypothetical protein
MRGILMRAEIAVTKGCLSCVVPYRATVLRFPQLSWRGGPFRRGGGGRARLSQSTTAGDRAPSSRHCQLMGVSAEVDHALRMTRVRHGRRGALRHRGSSDKNGNTATRHGG